jgi:PIN domain nuclease of toxin-antitoxin system
VRRLLVDTHALLWWLSDDPGLSEDARAAMADPSATLLVSSASVWEIAIKRALGRLTAPDDLLDVIADEGFSLLPVSGEHAWEVRRLPAHHRDLFDRLLVAQARLEGALVVTADPSFGEYDVARLW